MPKADNTRMRNMTKRPKKENPAACLRPQIRLRPYAEAALVLPAVSLLCYGDLKAALFLLPAMPVYAKYRIKELALAEKRKLRNDFREFLGSLQLSFRAGYSAENALRDAHRHLLVSLGACTLTEETGRIVRGLSNNVPAQTLLSDLAVRTDIPEIRQFAVLFKAAQQAGGSLPALLKEVSGQLGARIEAEKEIEAALAARKFEQRIMCMMPPFILVYMRFASPDFLTCLYGNLFGILVMSCALILYAAAFALGERITRIRV